MSKRANPVTIGLFVVGAFLILAGGLVFFGLAKMLQENPRFVLFFEESVNGLEKGAWVKFKGVPVGRVDEIRIRVPDQLETSDAIPVIIELDNQHISSDLGSPVDVSNEEIIAQQVRQGLRARLNTESLITGLFFVELDYTNPDEPFTYHQNMQRIPEIPTIPSQLQEIARSATEAIARIGDIDFDTLGSNLNRLVFIAGQRIEEVNIAQLSKQVDTALERFNQVLEPQRMEKLIVQIQGTLASFQSFAESADKRLPDILENLNASLMSFNATLDAAQRMIETVNETADPNSSLVRGLEATLQDVRNAAQSLEDLSAYLERNPNAFISGRSTPDLP
ncbi:MAG: MlaD family protein [Opitutales bacterium]|nr:MlaD family protein [Opitutales bacterium]NRA27121.1 MCE family protein [Opitutales bacterium]